MRSSFTLCAFAYLRQNSYERSNLLSKSFETVIILDFGSQYTQLIARRIRELGVYCEIHPFDTPITLIRRQNPMGVILSGGPSSIYEEGAPHCDPGILDLGKPILGVCYGLQHLSYFLGGKVEPSSRREYGAATVRLTSGSLLLSGLPDEFPVWMSHGDHVTVAPPGFRVIAETENALGAIENVERRLYGLQFHPEVAHTPDGKNILNNFVRRICGCSGDWSASTFIDAAVDKYLRTDRRWKSGLRPLGGCRFSGSRRPRRPGDRRQVDLPLRRQWSFT